MASCSGNEVTITCITDASGKAHQARRGSARAEDAPKTPTQSHISPSILVYEDKHTPQRADDDSTTRDRDSAGVKTENAWQRRAPSQGRRPSAAMWQLLPSLRPSS